MTKEEITFFQKGHYNRDQLIILGTGLLKITKQITEAKQEYYEFEIERKRVSNESSLINSQAYIPFRVPAKVMDDLLKYEETVKSLEELNKRKHILEDNLRFIFEPLAAHHV